MPLAPERAAEIEEELAHHMEAFYATLLGRGIDSGRAAAMVRAEVPRWRKLAHDLGRAERPVASSLLGGASPLDDHLFEKGRWLVFGELWFDMRHALRTFLRERSFTAVAVAALALGIGSTTTVFSVFNAILNPLPFDESDRLVMLRDEQGESDAPASLPEYRDWDENSRAFEDMAAYFNASASLTGEGLAEELWRIRATANLLPTLGVEPHIGRGFTVAEEVPGNDDVVLISHGLWHRKFAGDPAIVGLTVMLRNRPTVVIGVLPASYRGVMPADLTRDRVRDLVFPLGLDEDISRGAHFLRVVGRLDNGVTLEAARAEVNQLGQGLIDDGVTPHSITVHAFEDYVVGDRDTAVLILLGAVTCLLLISCVNVANLLLTRASASRRDSAIRIAIGASRGRLIRQRLTESAFLALASGLAGLVLTYWGIQIVAALDGEWLPLMNEVAIDMPVLLFSLGVSVATGLLFGSAPAVLGSRATLGDSLREGGRTLGAVGGSGRLRGALVVTEVALSLILLIGAGLLVRSFFTLIDEEKGFETERTVSVDLSIGSRYTDPESRRRFSVSLVERLGALPGVEAVGIGSDIPLDGSDTNGDITIDGRDQQSRPIAHKRIADEHYFEAIGIPLLRGRNFSASDSADSPGVAIIDEELAEAVFPGEDPIGKRVGFDWFMDGLQEVVGVVGSVRELSLGQEPEPTIYVSSSQRSISDFSVIVRSSVDPSALAASVRRVVYEIGPNQPVSRVRVLDDMVAQSVAGERLIALLLGGCSLIAMLLAAIGIYGVLSYSVSKRTHEIGIRMALGAGRREVLRHILREGMVLAMGGIVVGLIGAFLATRFLESLLYGVVSTDTLVYAAISALLLGVAFIACRVPAGRATRVDPLVALRHE